MGQRKVRNGRQDTEVEGTEKLILVLSEERAQHPESPQTHTQHPGLHSSKRILLGSQGSDPARTAACSKQRVVSEPRERQRLTESKIQTNYIAGAEL